jgi:hypothetical protein
MGAVLDFVGSQTGNGRRATAEKAKAFLRKYPPALGAPASSTIVTGAPK